MVNDTNTARPNLGARAARYQLAGDDLLSLLEALGVGSKQELEKLVSGIGHASELPAVLLSKGLASEHTLAALGLEQFDQAAFAKEIILVEPSAVSLIDIAVSARRRFLPIAVRGSKVHVAVADLLDLPRIEEIRATLPSKFVLAPELWPGAELRDAIEMAFDGRFGLDVILNEITGIDAQASIDTNVRSAGERRPAPSRPPFELRRRKKDVSVASEGPRRLWAEPGVRLANALFSQAIASNATAMMFVDVRSGGEFRYRSGSRLSKTQQLSPVHLRHFFETTKIEAGDEHRFQLRLGTDQYAVDWHGAPHQKRCHSTFTSTRLSAPVRPVKTLGLSTTLLRDVKRILVRPRGLTLIATPPRQGRSTLLASLARLALGTDKDVTYIARYRAFELPNMVYREARDAAAYASAIAQAARDETDFVVVDDAQDPDSWRAMVDLALAGVRVFSTLPATNIFTAQARIKAAGIDSEALGLALNGVIAAALVPALCPACKVPSTANEATQRLLNMEDGSAEPSLYEPAGCAACGQTGYDGVLPIGEALPVDGAIANLIAQDTKHTLVWRAAIDEFAVKSLQDDGRARARSGDISLRDLLRFADLLES